MKDTVTVRVQKVKKSGIKTRLIFFLILVAILLLVTLFANQIAPYDPYAQDLSRSMLPPSPEHWMGTDRYGRDLFSRVLVGAQTSIFATLALVGVISLFGTVVGTLCGYYGGALDSVVMRISDVCLAFPGLVFALAIAALLGGGVSNAVLALAVISWPKYARVARSQTLALKNSSFVAAARLSGSTSGQMILRHILPNILGPILVTAMLDIGTMMMELAGPWRAAAHGRVGQHDERRPKYAADLSLAGAEPRLRDFPDGRDLQSAGRYGARLYGPEELAGALICDLIYLDKRKERQR